MPSSPATSTVRPLWREGAFLIIVVTGVFHLGRGAVVDGVIFLVVAALLVGRTVVDGKAHPPRGEPLPVGRRFGPARLVLVTLSCLLYGLVVGQWDISSAARIVAIVVPGLVVMTLALVAVESAYQPVRRGWWAWALAGLLTCVWELVAFLQQESPAQGSYDHPTLSVILDPVFAARVPRSLLLAAWLAVGLMLARLLLSGRRPGPRP